MEKKAKAEAKRIRRIKRKQGVEEDATRPDADPSLESTESEEESGD